MRLKEWAGQEKRVVAKHTYFGQYCILLFPNFITSTWYNFWNGSISYSMVIAWFLNACYPSAGPTFTFRNIICALKPVVVWETLGVQLDINAKFTWRIVKTINRSTLFLILGLFIEQLRYFSTCQHFTLVCWIILSLGCLHWTTGYWQQLNILVDCEN